MTVQKATDRAWLGAFRRLQAQVTALIAAGTGVNSVTDGTTTVSPATSLDFTSGATVTDGGSGVAQIAVTGGGGGFSASYAGGFNTYTLAPATTQLVSIDDTSDGSAGSDVELNMPTPDFILHGLGLYQVSWEPRILGGTAVGGASLSASACLALVTVFQLNPEFITGGWQALAIAFSQGVLPVPSNNQTGSFLMWTFDDPVTTAFTVEVDGTFGTCDLSIDITVAKLASA